MLKTKKYKLYPINGSLDYTMSLIIKYIESKYDVFDTIIKSKIKLDKTKVGGDCKNMKRPEFVYVVIHNMNKTWTNSGGILHTSFILMDKETIDIRWDTDISNFHKSDYKDFDIKIFRKLKLEKLKNVKNR